METTNKTTSRFLPPPAVTFAISSENNVSDFQEYDTKVIQHALPSGMSFTHGKSEARVPSIFSRAYLFYFSLGSGFLTQSDHALSDEEEKLREEALEATKETRDQLRQQARNVFRGICALFALRQVYGLRIEAQAAPDFAQLLKGTAPLTGKPAVVASMFARQTAAEPDGEENPWKQLTYFTVVTGSGDQIVRRVVAGFSPLTGFFPAAKAFDPIPSVFWYTKEDGWRDPSNSTFSAKIDSGSQAAMRRLLSGWVDAVLHGLNDGVQPIRVDLLAQGMRDDDVEILTKELTAWKDDLQSLLADEPAETHKIQTTSEQPVLAAAAANAATLKIPRFFGLVCNPDAYPFLQTDLPIVEGKLCVSEENLLDAKCRLYGLRYGAPAFKSRIPGLGLSGKNLGSDLGLGPEAIPRPYILLDRIFTPYLTRISTSALDSKWTGLRPAASDAIGAVTDESVYLYPIAPEALGIIGIEQLSQSVQLETYADERAVVKVSIGKEKVSATYGGSSQYKIDDTIPPDYFDVRMFPNFRLDKVAAGILPGDSPDRADSPDRVFYARLRLSPRWCPKAEAPADDFWLPVSLKGGVISCERFRNQLVDCGSFTDSDDAGSVKYEALGVARFLRFTEAPAGFYFKDRGICLVELAPGPAAGDSSSKRIVAVDFGTSTTCLAWTTKGDQQAAAEVWRLPMLTTSLKRNPKYGKIYDSDEGQSAMLDFFLYDPVDRALQPTDFIPTQITTLRHGPPLKAEFANLDVGMIVFRNLSHGELDDSLSLSRLLKSFEAPLDANSAKQIKPRFKVISDIKWSGSAWLEVYMVLLRKHAVVAAARDKAMIVELRLSHPKSFGTTQVSNFETVICSTWPGFTAGPATKAGSDAHTFSTTSESEGVRRYIAKSGHKDWMVFDIGGGTTDLLAFDGENPFFQMSFRLAGGKLDRYVVASPRLRERLGAAAVDAIAAISGKYDEAGALQDRLKKLGFHSPVAVLTREKDGPSPEMVHQQTIWHGLLASVDKNANGFARLGGCLKSIFEHPETDANAKLALKGFFLSLLTLFGGVAYLGGMMNRLMKKGGDAEPGSNVIQMGFIGNGGKYYDFLGGMEPGELEQFMISMYKAGDTRADRKVGCPGVFKGGGGGASGGAPQPKAAIALGMLDKDFATECKKDLQVCNFVGENGHKIAGISFTAGSDLDDYYSAVFAAGDSPIAVDQSGSRLDGFLKALGEATKQEWLKDYMPHPEHPGTWVEHMLEDHRSEINAMVEARIRANAAGWNAERHLSSNQKVAFEPVFVSELASVIDLLTERYAK